MSMVELAELVLLDEKKPLKFKDVFKKVAEMKELTTEAQDQLIAQFYTDLNMNGRFVSSGKNMWGLKRWYLAKQVKEGQSDDPRVMDNEEEEELLGLEDEEEFDEYGELGEAYEDAEDLMKNQVMSMERWEKTMSTMKNLSLING